MNLPARTWNAFLPALGLAIALAATAGAAVPTAGSHVPTAATEHRDQREGPLPSLSVTEGWARLRDLAAAGAKGLPGGGEALAGVIVVGLTPAAAREGWPGPDAPPSSALPRPVAVAPCFAGVAGTPLAATRLLFLAAGDSPDAAASAWSRAEGVAWAEPYRLHRLAAVPDDPGVPQQLHLEPIGAFAAWDLVRGETSPVPVAVVDGGVDITHLDLAANVLLNAADPPNGRDDDGNGLVDDHRGWNFATGTDDPAALLAITPLSVDHGTHVAGILSAVTDNGRNVAGVTWNGPVLAVAAGHPTRDDLVVFGYQGILYAAQRGVRLINCSWGRAGRSSLLEMAVLDYVEELGAVIIAAAGNEASDAPFYPAAYRQPFAVANVTAAGGRYGLSNYGLWVDLAAPGTFIYSLLPNDRAGHMTGTSMAAPVVAGTAALLWGWRPELSPPALLERLRLSCRSLAETLGGFADSLGAGMIQTAAALGYAGPGYRIEDLGLADADGDGQVELGERVELTPTWRNLLGAGTAPVFVSLTSAAREIGIVSGSALLGPLAAGEAGTAAEPFVIEVSPIAAAGTEVLLEWTVVGGGAGGYRDRFTSRLAVAPLFADLASGEVQATITGNGRIGFQGIGGGNGRDGLGVRYVPAGQEDGAGPLGNLLFEGAIMLGTGPDRLSNAARRHADGRFDQHFVPLGPQRNPRLLPRVALRDGQELDRAAAIFRDALAPDRLRVVVGWDLLAPPAGEGPGCALLLTTIRNEGNEHLTGFHCGFFLDWDLNAGGFFPSFTANSTELDPGGGYATVHRADGLGATVATALVADGPHAVRFRAIDNTGASGGWGIYDGFTDAEKWEALSADDGPVAALETDISHTWAAGPFDLEPGDSLRCVLVLTAGPSGAAAGANALAGVDLARRLLAQRRLAPPPLPFTIGQPYPNPWNGSVKLPVAGNPLVPWRLVVYDLRGRRIFEDVLELPGSSGVLAWDGVDQRGRGVATGVYLLRAGQGAAALTRKVILTR